MLKERKITKMGEKKTNVRRKKERKEYIKEKKILVKR